MYVFNSSGSSHSVVMAGSSYSAGTANKRNQPTEDSRLCELYQINKQLFVDLSKSKICADILEKDLHLKRELDSNIRHHFNTSKSKEYLDSSTPTMDFDHLCNQSHAKSSSKKLKYLACFFILISVLLWYINGPALERGTSFEDIKEDLCQVKSDMNSFKSGFTKDTREQITSIQKDTDKKLETIEGLLHEIKKNQNAPKTNVQSPRLSKSAKNNDPVYQVVQQALEEYSADKTGKIDFALESAGGRIIRLENTTPIKPSESTTLFGIPICSSSQDAKSLIRANSLPGECWGFKGSEGTVVIRLLGRVKITCVSIEHISKSISPTGEIDSAPKDFSIFGLSHDQAEGTKLGQFIYDINGPPIQYFGIGGDSNSFEYIKFKVHSNHGNSVYTCVYRLRVHGVFDKN